jgi:hypothetical protein
VFASVALALLVTAHAWAQTPIRVGAWNIEQLGEPNSRDFPMHRPTHGFGVAQSFEITSPFGGPTFPTSEGG